MSTQRKVGALSKRDVLTLHVVIDGKTLMWFTKAIFALLLAAAYASGVAQADSQDIKLGWMNIQECSRMTCSGKGLFCPDTLETAPQELSGYLHIEAPSVSSVIEYVRHCAIDVAVPAAGITAIVTSPAAAQPVFFEAFNSCITGQAWSSMYLFADSQCKW